jgi:hypothetical protein
MIALEAITLVIETLRERFWPTLDPRTHKYHWRDASGFNAWRRARPCSVQVYQVVPADLRQFLPPEPWRAAAVPAGRQQPGLRRRNRLPAGAKESAKLTAPVRGQVHDGGNYTRIFGGYGGAGAWSRRAPGARRFHAKALIWF